MIPVYEQGSQFQPTAIEMMDGQTSPPQLLTEADLIALMEKHGIGRLQWLFSYVHRDKCAFGKFSEPLHFVTFCNVTALCYIRYYLINVQLICQ